VVTRVTVKTTLQLFTRKTDVAYVIVVTSYMDMSSDVAHTIVVTSLYGYVI